MKVLVKNKKTIWVVLSVLSIILSCLVIISLHKNKNTSFQENPDGIATSLDYSEDFERFNKGVSVASITGYDTGFLGVYYGLLYYFDPVKKSVEEVTIPSGLYNIEDIRFEGKDQSLVWDATGVYYDNDLDLLYVANYRGHNILVCYIEMIDGVPQLELKDIYKIDGMMSPENIYANSNIIAVADYDGNALWILEKLGGVVKKVDVQLAHGVAISSKAIFVTSLMDRKIYKYSFDGELLGEVGDEAFEGKDAFLWPTGLDICDDKLIVSDAHTGRISIYDLDLGYISSIGGFGPSDNAFNFPYCATNIDGDLYVGDVFNKRIVVIDQEGKIKRIWGEKIRNIEDNIVYHQTSDIPYTYGRCAEAFSKLFNPLIDSELLLGYDSIWLNNDGNDVQIASTDYMCNMNIFSAEVPRLDQLYTIWIKHIEINNKSYYVIGSPEATHQLYIYNETDNIFFISSEIISSPIWYLDGKWYCKEDINNVLTGRILKADDSQKKYLELISSGTDRRTAYAKSFLNYYNSIYKGSLLADMTEDDLYLWIKSFLSTENGKIFWGSISNDPDELRKVTMDYYLSTQYGGSTICESLMVRMLGNVGTTDSGLEEFVFNPPANTKWYATPVPESQLSDILSSFSSDNSEKQKNAKVKMDIYHYCYYDETEDGYETNPGWKKSEKELDDVALVIIDPWKDSPFPELNNDVQDNVIEYIIPIIESAQDNGVKTFVFTNNPETIDYDTEIVDDLKKLVDNNTIELHYYDEFSDSNEFAQYMQNRGFDTLVYAGYAVEMCVGYRNSGVVQNYLSDYGTAFERYVIPEACLGLVSENDDENSNMRDMTVMAYSQQNIADVIYFDDWIKAYGE